MSNLCLFTDSHIRGRDWNNKQILLKRMVEICKERKVDYILNLGDTFDKGEVGDKFRSSEKLVKGYTDIFNIDIPIIQLEGNHDQSGSDISALDFIHLNNTTKIKDEVKILNFPDFDLACIPWIRSDKNYRENVMNSLNSYEGKAKVRILIGHVNIINCSLGKHGYCTPEHYFSFGLPDLLNSGFKPSAQFFGHVHCKNYLTENSWYLGALSHLRFDEDEGKKAGFHLYDTVTNKLEFINLSDIAANYYTICEEDLEKYNISKDYIRFYTENPERYKHLFPHVKALYKQNKLENSPEIKTVYEQSRSNDLTIDNLIARYCQLKELIEPTSDFYKEEKSTLSVGLVKKPTGFDRLKSVKFKNVGIHKDKTFEFKDGFTAIIGRNGSGKSSLVDSLPGALYDNFPIRGNIKNYMTKGSRLELNVEACGRPYKVVKECKGSSVQSSLNDASYTLAKEFRAEVHNVFGDSATFNRLVFMDQSSQYDLVGAEEAARLKLLREIFDLNAFDKKYTEYNELLRDTKKHFEESKKIQSEIDSLQKEYDAIVVEENIDFDSTVLSALTSKLSRMKDSKRQYENNLIFMQKIEKIKEYENNNNVKEIKEKVIRINVLESKLRLSKNWNEIGCKASPLPCIFLKNNVTEDYISLEKELTDLYKHVNMEEYKNYSYLLNNLGKDVKVEKVYTQKDIDELQAEINNYNSLKIKKQHNDQIKLIKNSIKNRLTEKTNYLLSLNTDKLDEKIKDLQFLVEICGKYGLSLYIINLIKNELQEIINELIEKAELDLIVNLSTEGKEELDSFKILFGKDQYDIKLASGGEIALVKLLFKLTIMVYLNRYFGTYKTLIIDEGLAFVDDYRVEASLELLKVLKKDFNQIIIATHQDVVANFAEHRIEL